MFSRWTEIKAGNWHLLDPTTLGVAKEFGKKPTKTGWPKLNTINITSPEFARVMKRLSVATKSATIQTSDLNEMIDVYYEVLGGYPLEAWEYAAKIIMETMVFFPAIAEIKPLLDKWVPPMPMDAQLGSLARAVERIAISEEFLRWQWELTRDDDEVSLPPSSR